MSRPEARPLLPQTNPMSQFSFAPPNMGVGDTKKNYVFVDEHNRHKRLKVMRACEGCRRRKIKCDAATTNSWPCAACVRLKLQCVPPTVNYNRAQIGAGQISGHERVLDFADSSGDSGDESFMPMPRSYAQNMFSMGGHPDMITSQPGYTSGMMSFSPSSYPDNITSMPMSASADSYPGPHSFHQQVPSTGSAHGDDAATGNLSDVLGELKIDEKGMAPYIYQQRRTLAEAPALEEAEYDLPAAVTPGPGTTVRIPPELMPSDDLAAEYFNIFFEHIHPYVPVISKSYFYQQWTTNRGHISPLLLEAIFACAGRFSDDPAQGAQWLALASKHETCFMDVPRLSTIQALLLLLKAREANPKRGYYYRSWMTVKTVCEMAKDLDLDEHMQIHDSGSPCPHEATECMVRTRIWQNIFVCEIMVGGPQGRYDMGTETSNVDFGIPQTPPGSDDEEYSVSRNYVWLARAIRNVRNVNDTYKQIKNEKDWASHPKMAALNPQIPNWLNELPSEMQIHYPPDGSAPLLTSHYVGNVHCYYHLGVLIAHRPQLMASESFAGDGPWKQHMEICYRSAKSLCRIQEALLNNFGIDGLLYMQRGINFAIYCVLTCTMIHLAAITNPDPDFNTDAKEYFTRHMRVLEQCITAWPMKDLQKQVQSLREAFSANVGETFKLKPTFPYGSPVSRLATSPLSETHYNEHTIMQPTSQDQGYMVYPAGPMTPPISAGHDDPKDGSLAASMAMMASGPRHQASIPGSHLGEENLSWNPTRLFEYGSKSLSSPPSSDNIKTTIVRTPANSGQSQWNTAFGTPTSTVSIASNLPQQHPHSPTAMYSPTASTVGSVHDFPSVHDQIPHNYNVTSNMGPSPSQISTPTSATSHPFVSPTMWQDTVASTYVPNDLKRRWDGISGPAWGGHDQQQVKRPHSGHGYV